jgi:hypothetical protein
MMHQARATPGELGIMECVNPPSCSGSLQKKWLEMPCRCSEQCPTTGKKSLAKVFKPYRTKIWSYSSRCLIISTKGTTKDDLYSTTVPF